MQNSRRLSNTMSSQHSPDTDSLASAELLTPSHSQFLNEKNGGDSSSLASKQSNILHASQENVQPITKSTTLLSKITTVKFDDSLIVPPLERRGLFTKLCLIPEYQDARELPSNLRRFIVFVVAFCAMIGPMGTSILLPASDNAVADLGTTITILNVAIGVYLITLGVIPIWWSNLSERHGRRSIYIVSFILYLCFTIGCALSNNVNTLIGFRVLSGGCAASVQSVGAGTIGDLYPITKRGMAMGLFYLGPLAGPLLSPIIGGAITSNKNFGWRATQWFLVILSGGCCLLIIFFLPETLRKQDNKDAIRKILRDRRRNKIPKKDEEESPFDSIEKEEMVKQDQNSEASTNEELETRNKRLSNKSDNPIALTRSNMSLSSLGSVNSEVLTDDYIPEEEVERLNKLLTRMSTRQSFSSIVDRDGTKSRKTSISSKKICKGDLVGNTHLHGETVNGNVEDVEDDYIDEAPVMDSVVPLSKVPTANRNNFLERKKMNTDSIANELENIQKIQHGSKIQLFRHYLKIYLYGPLKAFVFVRYPPVFLSIAYSAPCFAALYVQNMTLTYKYSRDPYNFSPVLVGLVYIPNYVAYFIASIWGGKFNDYLLKKKIEKYGIVAPEARFGINVYVAAAILPCSMLLTGWCLEYDEQWVTPLIGTALFGFAQMIVIGVTITYLADCLPGKGATGIALNNFVRMIMAAGVSFATEPLIRAIGTGVLFSICAGIIAVLSVLLIIIIKYGDHWRENYDLEKLYDIVDS